MNGKKLSSFDDMTKIIFFGTPDYIIPILEALHKNFELVAVVTQPPKLVGRKQLRTFTPVDDWAHKRKIPAITDFADNLPEADLGVVASYGRIIPDSVLNHFKSGVLNIHPSLLPKYRGASPIQTQIIDGLTNTGVTVIKMDSKMDHGPIISSFQDVITQEDTNETLRKRLFERSSDFIINLIPNYLNKKISLKEQEEKNATFTKIIDKNDGFIEPSDLEASFTNSVKAIYIDRFVRAMAPWPEVWTKVILKPGEMVKRLKILKVHVENDKLILDKVQLEGKKPVSFEEFKRGYPQMNF